MNARLTYVIGPLLALMVAGIFAAWWFDTMEKHWTPNYRTSDAATKNPMLAAQKLLNRHQYTVQMEETMSSFLLKPAMPRGTVILAQNEGVMTRPQVDQLLSWVARGNNLILSPAWSTPKQNVKASDADEDEGDSDGGGDSNNTATKGGIKPNAANDMRDDVGAHFGISLKWNNKKNEVCRSDTVSEDEQKKKLDQDVVIVDCSANITLPEAEYPLHLEPIRWNLAVQASNRKMLFFDDEGKAVRAFAYGRGRVVFVAQNYFSNDNLPSYDHAELLLALADFNDNARRVTIVEHLDSPAWYSVLWAMFPQSILAFATALILLGWAAVRRFGPLLPEPNLIRRSMLEHVEASSRWLWKSGKGREVLLDAARAATLKILLRRVPQLQGKNEQDKVALLAEQTGLLQSDIDVALHNIAASRPQDFTRQIQTLQRLRKHYER
jgi:hypothetical protein